ncbi:hypothetical protein BU17DRAFT_39422 [Hysterangium stoloniferum]|nr:hypothetical protein BU17DRAFT_39422 [Hysterangium stoloniferum]
MNLPSSVRYDRRTGLSIRSILPSHVRGRIDKQDAGLYGVDGAHRVIQLLRMNNSVYHLVLSHNKLGNAGCVMLFDYLRSEEGKRHEIVEISLNANCIGDEGLLAIARYLENNKSLTTLFLQHGAELVMLRFTLAINNSNLQILSFTNNANLGDVIASTLLPNLSARNLNELHFSGCSLKPTAMPAILSYITSPRALSLHILKLNGNPFGMNLVLRVVEILERCNWSITLLEMHACGHSEGILDGSDSWRDYDRRLSVILNRNRIFGKKTAEEALFLLRHARPALLAYGRGQNKGVQARLPPELIIYTLSFLAPSLSAAQHIRVCSYAGKGDTLPSFGLSMPTASSHQPIATFLWLNSSQQVTPRGEEARTAWLRQVECDRYEPDQFEFIIEPQ